MSIDQAKQIATEILKQLGGNRFIAMTGAKDFICDGAKIMFKIGRNATSANYVTVELNGMDTYDMKFERISISKKTMEMNRKTINEFNGIYNDMLQSSFTEATGLYISL